MTLAASDLIAEIRPGPNLLPPQPADGRERRPPIPVASHGTTDPRLELAEAMATRICHDLAGLCGTLTGALGLIAEDGGDAGEAAAIAAESARRMSDRLRLLRAAWGGGTETLDRAGIEALAPGLPNAHRLTLSAAGLDAQPALAGGLAQIVLNAILLAAESLPRGGTIAITTAIAGAGAGASVRIAGTNAAWPDELRALLHARTAPPADFAEPRRMQAPLLVLLSRRNGLALHLRPAQGAADTLDIQPTGER